MDHLDDSFFQVSVKGLCYDLEGRIMLLLEKDGNWEPVGGRVQKGENLIESLQRECLEETGITCDVLEKNPTVAFSTIDRQGRGRILLFYKIKMHGFAFTPNDECLDIKFFSKEELRTIPMMPQLRGFIELLP